MSYTGDYPTIPPARDDKILVTDVSGNVTANILVSDLDKVLYKSGVGSYSNLIVKSTSVTQADIDADFVTLWNSTDGLAYQAGAVNLTVDISASGANGLDTGSEAGSTWYFLWVIYNPTTDTVAGLISLSTTAPTMPSGYTFKKLIGIAYNDAGSDLDAFIQYDNWINWTIHVASVTGGASGSYSAVSPNVPTIATAILVTESCVSAAARFDYSTDGTNVNGFFEATAGSTRGAKMIFLNASQQYYYLRNSGAGTLSHNTYGIQIKI